jgi:hypothetical protein
LLTANRFDQIKKRIDDWQGGEPIWQNAVSELFDMLKELADEIDRLRMPAQAGGRGHLKPVILDAQGQAVVPPPLAHQFAAERREQYDSDRFDAIMNPDDIDRWRVFCLRWGLAPPPGGWKNREAITNVIHAVRLGVRRVPHLEKHISAMHLKAKGIGLPPGVTLAGGDLHGTESDS